ncbi:MAG: hypothetical protein ACXW05_09880 [Gemmatirosa sp.]
MTDALLAVVNRVLYTRWDPLGVHRVEDAFADEYEGYAAGVLALVLRHSSDDAVAEHLARIEDRWMGLRPSPLARRVAIAAEIRRAVRAARDAMAADEPSA